MSEPGQPDQHGPADGGPPQPYSGGGPSGPQAYPAGGSSGPPPYFGGGPSGSEAYPAGSPSGPPPYQPPPGAVSGPAGPQAYPAGGPQAYSAGGPSGPPPYQVPPFQYPQWQLPAPPKKTSPAAVVLISGSLVVIVLMVLAFLAWGYPGFLREPDSRGAAAPAASPTSPTSTVTVPSTPAALPNGARVPMPKRSKPLADPVTCAFTPDPSLPAPKKATPPPDGPTSSSGTVDVRLATSAGDIGLTLDRALAPCTVVNFLSLAKQGFYDGTSCHRLSVTAGLRMLQCGDPVGDGTGSPGYTIRDEVFPELTYGRGILAMAKTSQPDSGGSQFFLVYGDVKIPPDYTVFGSIDDAGLAVLDKVAGGGVDPAKPGMGDGSGPPKIPVTFTHVSTP